ncbi:hypothetical protein G210_4325 [Candida maltosa Xu316]|uniref:Uncharacterized protein n=1 Tax=Candida maltosa (strain Xu316) TaxID=1245528 RepID=M3JRS6_CANMX|nr:hypothetical protein G210_4325 [Candida maltosa Xu316]
MSNNWRFNVRSNHSRVGQKTIFESFIYPIVEEAIKIIIIYYEYDKFNLNLMDVGIIWFGYCLILSNIYQYNPYAYEEIYKKFLNYYHIWMNQNSYKCKKSLDNIEEIETLFQSFSTCNAEQQQSKVKSLRNSMSSEDSSKTLTVDKKLSYKNLPAEFNLNSDKFTNSSTSTSTPMKISNSCNSFTTITKTSSCIKNYKSCQDFVDKLYSVSPKNTYHLNTATAIAALELDTHHEDEENHEQECPLEAPASPAKTILPDVPRVFENIDDDDDDNQSVHSNGTNFGGGGGGNFKLKLPNGGKIEFGGGAGGGYKHGDDDDNDNNKKAKTTTTKHSIIRLLNWFSWLLPPLFPIGERKKIKLSESMIFQPGERFPLLKQRLSVYSLNEQQQRQDTEDVDFESCEIITKPTIERSIKFQYFMSFYFDISITSPISSIKSDPFFVKFGELLVNTPTIWVFLDELNFLLFHWILFAMYFTNIVVGIPVIFVAKMFKENYLHSYRNRIDYHRVLIGESVVNLVLLFIEVVLFYRRLNY